MPSDARAAARGRLPAADDDRLRAQADEPELWLDADGVVRKIKDVMSRAGSLQHMAAWLAA